MTIDTDGNLWVAVFSGGCVSITTFLWRFIIIIKYIVEEIIDIYFLRREYV